jgi:hypothetical protein
MGIKLESVVSGDTLVSVSGETMGRERQWAGRDNGQGETMGRERQWAGRDNGQGETMGRERP